MTGELEHEGAETQTQWLAPAQAARRLDVTPTRIGQLADEGRLKHVRTPLGRLIDSASVDALRRQREARKGR